MIETKITSEKSESAKDMDSWLSNKLNDAMAESNRAYTETLQSGLPRSARISLTTDSSGVSGEVSHGLTHENLSNAAIESIRISKKKLEDMVTEGDQRFG